MAQIPSKVYYNDIVGNIDNNNNNNINSDKDNINIDNKDNNENISPCRAATGEYLWRQNRLLKLYYIQHPV